MTTWENHLITTEALGHSWDDGLGPITRTLITQQRHKWPRLAHGLTNLESARQKQLTDPRNQKVLVDLIQISGRYDNAAAMLDPHGFCPLCIENLPSEEQGIAFEERLAVFPNPNPILTNHLVGVHKDHVPQELRSCLPHMADLLKWLREDMMVLYNGPTCGASSPFHLHIQMGAREELPLLEQIQSMEPELSLGDSGEHIYALQSFGRRFFLISTGKPIQLSPIIAELMDMLDPGEEAPVNLVLWRDKSTNLATLFPRGRHRPSCFYLPEPQRLVVSPGSVEMAGLVVVPRAEDFERIDASIMETIYREVSLPDEAWHMLLTRVEARFG